MVLRILATLLIGSAAGAVAAASACSVPAADQQAPSLRFDIEEGPQANAFLRAGPVSAHLLQRAGPRPRVLVAFPAGNSGVGLWFETDAGSAGWHLRELEPLHACDARGRDLHGVSAELEYGGSRLRLRQALLGSVRVLREYELTSARPDAATVDPVRSERALQWQRDRLDGAAGYWLSLEVLGGSVVDADGVVELHATAGESLRLRLRAATGESPLTPLAATTRPGVGDGDERSRQVLEFLSYREKLLAGSWRFNTYFGRDTLISLRLLMPALEPEAVEAGLAAVLERVSARGEVAHEEEIGEFAVLRRQAEGLAGSDPLHVYSMVDDDVMLAPVLAAWLLGDPRARTRAAAFLAVPVGAGQSRGDALVRNLDWITARAGPFAAEPSVANLIGLQHGAPAGQWRDSDEGLGRGRYPYDVNVVFVPAALSATAALLDSGLLDPYLSLPQRQRLHGAAHAATVWNSHAPPLFVHALARMTAQAHIAAYASHLGVPSVGLEDGVADPVAFDTLSLDAEGRPVPVLHSDVGFLWLFADPPAEAIARSVGLTSARFPAGLMTDAGLLVANPVFAGPDAWKRLDSHAYHGTVVWPWQHALWVAGLRRQLARDDLPADLRESLASLERRLWRAIDATSALRTSELWAWSFVDGRYRAEPFGARAGDEDESNAAQLWSTVFLALPRPSDDHASTTAAPSSEARTWR